MVIGPVGLADVSSLRDAYHVAFDNPDGERLLIVTNPGAGRAVQVRLAGMVADVSLPGDSLTTLTWKWDGLFVERDALLKLQLEFSDVPMRRIVRRVLVRPGTAKVVLGKYLVEIRLTCYSCLPAFLFHSLSVRAASRVAR